jgi:plastocyanin
MISLTLLLAASAAIHSEPSRNDEVGSISGKVVWEGERPAPKPDLDIKPEATAGCHDADTMDKTDESLLIGEQGGVANVVLTIEVAGAEKKVPAEPIVFDQEGCRFHPHVAVVPVGATLRFANSDETNHNVHTFAKRNQSINKNIAGGTSHDEVVDQAEVIDVKCDIHPWMRGFVFVTDAARYAVTDAEGNFKIEGVPPGKYKLSYWHESGTKGKTEDVMVEGGSPADVTIAMGGKERRAGGARRR